MYKKNVHCTMYTMYIVHCIICTLYSHKCQVCVNEPQQETVCRNVQREVRKLSSTPSYTSFFTINIISFAIIIMVIIILITMPVSLVNHDVKHRFETEVWSQSAKYLLCSHFCFINFDQYEIHAKLYHQCITNQCHRFATEVWSQSAKYI